MSSTLRAVVAASLALASIGCRVGDGPKESTDAVVRDSAGVMIVENRSPDEVSRLEWDISAEPELSIGALDGEPEYQLFRVEDAIRLDDGRILIANGGTSEIRVFDGAGIHLESWGREGEGPGEFTGLTDLALWPGDSIMAWDFAQNRLTLFDDQGGLGRSQALSLGEGLGLGRFEGVLPDGSIITAGLISFGSDERTTGLMRRSREFSRVHPDGQQLTSFGSHQDEEYYVGTDPRALVRHPFRRSVHSAIWNGHVIISPSDRYDIRAYDPSGALAMNVRLDHRPERVTQADVDEYIEARLANMSPETRPTMIRAFEGMPPVESFPAFSALIVDAEGDLWVRDYELPEVERSVWTVFSRDGRVRGRVETPPGLLIYRIGSNYLLGLMTDEVGVEYVRLWGLDRAVN